METNSQSNRMHSFRSSASTSQRPLSRRPLLIAANLLVLTGALAACGQSQLTPSNPPAPHLSALTLGPASGRVISGLQNVTLQQYDGSQNLSNYDLLIVDGDANTPSTIKTHAQVQRALALRKPILLVDVTEDHKKTGMGSLIGFNTRGKSDGYLIVPVQRADGGTSYHLYGTSMPQEPTAGLSQAAQQAGNDDATDLVFASKLSSNITAAQTISGGLKDTPTGVGPVEAQWLYSNTLPMTPGPTGTDQKSGQLGSATVNVTYTLYQNLNINTSSGGIQTLIVTTDATADPGAMAANSNNDKGWLLGSVNVKNTFSSVGNSNLSWAQSGPVAANNSTSYSSGTSTSIGFSGFSGEGSLSYNSEKNWSIPDWSVSGDLHGTDTSWRFKSANPNIDDVCKYGYSCAWFSRWEGIVNNPNTLSTSQSEYHTEALYHTDHLSADTISLTSEVDFGLDNFYNKYDQYGNFTGYGHGSGLYEVQFPVDINLTAVVPIPVSLIAFNYNVAPTNSAIPVTGTVTLKSPAITDTQVYLQAVSTSSNNATVPFSVMVHAGQTVSDPFSINLNGESNNGSNQDSSVTITTLYGTTASQLLKIHTYGYQDMQPPTTSPVADPNNWAETTTDAPAGSLWQSGYQVRYAVSFVDAQGNEARGPWSNWFNYGTSDGNTFYALPYLTQVPTDPSNKAVARRVYRQFYSEALTGTNPNGLLLQSSGNGNSVDGNTQTNFRDNTW